MPLLSTQLYVRQLPGAFIFLGSKKGVLVIVEVLNARNLTET